MAAGGYPGLKGLTIFSRDGCPYCQRAKAILKEIGAPYNYVDIQAEPERKEEAVKRTDGVKTVPQIFLGTDQWLGGYDDLKKLQESGELQEKLSTYIKSGSQEHIPGTPDDILQKYRESGALPDAAKKALLECGQEIRKRLRDGSFKPGRQPSILTYANYQKKPGPLPHDKSMICMNEPPETAKGGSVAAIEPVRLLHTLRGMMLELMEKFQSKEKGRMDYDRLADSEEWFTFLALAAELGAPSRLDQIQEVLEAMNENERKAFFINLYNCMTFHGLIQYGKKAGGWFLWVFFVTNICSYRVGKMRLSLEDIEHGILRMQPGLIDQGTPDREPCMKMQMTKLDPRIHAGLNCGAASCPPVAVYSGANIDSELDDAVESFVNADANFTLEIIDGVPKVKVTEIFKMYTVDFVGKDVDTKDSRQVAIGVLKWVMPFLLAKKKQLAEKCLKLFEEDVSGATFGYHEYDWTTNGELPNVDWDYYYKPTDLEKLDVHEWGELLSRIP